MSDGNDKFKWWGLMNEDNKIDADELNLRRNIIRTSLPADALLKNSQITIEDSYVDEKEKEKIVKNAINTLESMREREKKNKSKSKGDEKNSGSGEPVLNMLEDFYKLDDKIKIDIVSQMLDKPKEEQKAKPDLKQQDKTKNEAETQTEKTSNEDYNGHFKILDISTKPKKGNPVPAFKIVSSNKKGQGDTPKEQKDFRTMVDETQRTIDLLYDLSQIRKGKNERRYYEKLKKAIDKRDLYVEKLMDIAIEGLDGENPEVDVANDRLNGLRDTILVTEGAKAKNKYIGKLLFWTVIFGALAVLGALWSINTSENLGLPATEDSTAIIEETGDELTNDDLTPTSASDEETLKDIESELADDSLTEKNNYKGNLIYVYLFVFVGSLIGTIVSCVFRNEKLEFRDLVVMEEDMLKPALRLIITGLISILFMLFVTSKVFNMAIGGVPMSEIWRPENLEYQMLIGAIAGLTGNGLAGLLYSKANSVVGITGKK